MIILSYLSNFLFEQIYFRNWIEYKCLLCDFDCFDLVFDKMLDWMWDICVEVWLCTICK